MALWWYAVLLVSVKDSSSRAAARVFVRKWRVLQVFSFGFFSTSLPASSCRRRCSSSPTRVRAASPTKRAGAGKRSGMAAVGIRRLHQLQDTGTKAHALKRHEFLLLDTDQQEAQRCRQIRRGQSLRCSRLGPLFLGLKADRY